MLIKLQLNRLALKRGSTIRSSLKECQNADLFVDHRFDTGSMHRVY